MGDVAVRIGGLAGKSLPDAIGIEAGAGRVPCVEILIHQLGKPNGDIARQPGVKRARQLLNGKIPLELEVHDLTEGVHAGVGATGRRQRGRFTSQFSNRVAKRGLDGRRARLGLPNGLIERVQS